jgi:hypothetical protein
MMQLEDKCQAPTNWGKDLAGENQDTLHTRGGAEPKRLPDMDNNREYLTRTSHPFENSLKGRFTFLSISSVEMRWILEARKRYKVKNVIMNIDP